NKDNPSLTQKQLQEWVHSNYGLQVVHSTSGIKSSVSQGFTGYLGSTKKGCLLNVFLEGTRGFYFVWATSFSTTKVLGVEIDGFLVFVLLFSCRGTEEEEDEMQGVIAQVLREVTVETTAAGVWSKLDMTKSLANKLYLKKKLYTFYMPVGLKISEHVDEFNKIVLDLASIEVKFEDEDLDLLLLTSLPASYEHYVDTLLYEREALTLEDVMATLNSKEIKERSKAKGMMVKGYM
ncbi:hypothetical protein Tco_1297305, partial [Tanacetum coccineum]